MAETSTNWQAKRDELVARAECARLETEVRALETAVNYVDPMQWRTDAWGQPMYGAAAAQSDREDGDNRPQFNSETDLSTVRGIARVISSSTPHGLAIERNLKNYVIGNGFQYDATAKKRHAKNVPPGLLDCLQDTIDQFLDENNWTGDLDREFFWRGVRDGEVFLAINPQRDGTCEARTIEPEQVREPYGRQPNGQPLTADSIWTEDETGCYEYATSWSWGIRTPAHDVQTALGYSVQWTASSEWTYYPATCLEHVKRNVDRVIKRGVSDFFGVSEWLEGQKRLELNTMRGAQIQAAIAFIREHVAGVTKSQGENFRNDHATSTSQRYALAGQQTRYQRNWDAGTVLDVPNGQQYKPGPMGAERGNAFVAIGQAVLRTIGARWCMPEYLISGDASNANFASTQVAESPFIKNCDAEQFQHGQKVLNILWRVVRWAWERGRFRQFGDAGEWLNILRCVEITAVPPSLEVRDAKAETDRNVILNERGILSKKSWSQREGLDPEVEATNGASGAQDDEAAAAQAQQGSPAGGGLQLKMDQNLQQTRRMTKALQEIFAAARDGSVSDMEASTILQSMGATPEQAAKMLAAAKQDAGGVKPPAPDVAAEAPPAESAVTEAAALKCWWDAYP